MKYNIRSSILLRLLTVIITKIILFSAGRVLAPHVCESIEESHEKLHRDNRFRPRFESISEILLKSFSCLKNPFGPKLKLYSLQFSGLGCIFTAQNEGI
jgi:hypothetical protein